MRILIGIILIVIAFIIGIIVPVKMIVIGANSNIYCWNIGTIEFGY